MKRTYAGNLIKYQKLLKQFNSIYRDSASIHKESEPDNDADHSYRVAMLAWMIIEKYKLKLDVNKVLRNALLHDFVEIYSGDMSIYGTHTLEEKKKREYKSFLKLKKNFPEFKTFWKEIGTYEKKMDEEAKFVHIIDKIEPMLLVVTSDRNHFKSRKLTFDNFEKIKSKKIYTVKTFASEIYEDLLRYYKKHPELFPKK